MPNPKMPKVTFKCSCPQSIINVTVQAANDQRDVDSLTFKASGSKTIDRKKGSHFVAYRAVGTPGTEFELEVTKGGTMNPVSRTMPDNGRADGNRDLTVP